MCDDDYEPAALDVRKWMTARQAHRCCACKEAIRKRDRYHLTVCVQERGDRPDRWKHCARCWMICEALWEANEGGGIDLELNCGETWADHFDDEPSELAFMTPDEAQKKLKEHEDLTMVRESP
jgi:hypothetical protein